MRKISRLTSCKLLKKIKLSAIKSVGKFWKFSAISSIQPGRKTAVHHDFKNGNAILPITSARLKPIQVMQWTYSAKLKSIFQPLFSFPNLQWNSRHMQPTKLKKKATSWTKTTPYTSYHQDSTINQAFPRTLLPILHTKTSKITAVNSCEPIS